MEYGISSPTSDIFLEAKKGLVEVFSLKKRIYYKISELRFLRLAKLNFLLSQQLPHSYI